MSHAEFKKCQCCMSHVNVARKPLCHLSNLKVLYHGKVSLAGIPRIKN